LLAAKRLRQRAFAPSHVAVLWEKAVGSAHDAHVVGLSRDTSLQTAYAAGHLAALALLAAHGLQPTSAPGHHEVTFAAAAELGRGLDDLVSDSAEVRALRKGSVYDPILATDDDCKRARAWVRNTLPAVRSALVASDPALETLLKPYVPDS
jgi:hypothetical protein